MAHPLVGMWKLVRIDRTDGAEDSGEPAPTGCLLYTEQGWMSESLLLPVPGADGDTRTVIYCGTYEIENDRVIHQPKFHLDESQVGQDLPRGYRVAEDGQTFTLVGTIGELHWERVG